MPKEKKKTKTVSPIVNVYAVQPIYIPVTSAWGTVDMSNFRIQSCSHIRQHQPYLATVQRAHEAILPRHLFLGVMAGLTSVGTGDEGDLQDLAPTVELGIPNGTHSAGLMRLMRLIRLGLWCREAVAS